MKKRLLSVLLVMSLCFSLLPMTVWALDGDEERGDDSVVMLTHESETAYYDSFTEALVDASDGDTITLLENYTISMNGAYPIDVAITLDLAGYDLTICDDDINSLKYPLEVSKDLTVLNGTIIGGLIVTGGTVTVSGGDVGVKGPINITNNASVTISGSTRAVESTSKANVTLYGSTEVDGETSEEASFNDNTYYIDNEVAKKLSTEQVGQAPVKPAITLTEPEQVDGYVIPYGYAGMTVSIALDVSFRDTVSEDKPATVTYYVDGKEFATETWKSEQEAEEFIYLDDIFAACPVGIHTACVKLTYQGTSLTSKTYTATVVKSGTRISANTWRGGNPETTFDYGETFTVSVSVEPTGMSTYSAETEPTENYVVVCENGREISERKVYDEYGVNFTVDTQDLGAGEHTLTVNYVGCNEMDSATNTVDVTVEKSGLSVVSSADYTYNKSFTGKPIPNPTAAQLTILNSSTQERVDSASVYDKIEFEWYAATKTYDNRIGEYLYGKISDTPIDGTPIDAGDYILDVNFPETDNYCSSSSNINLTVNKTQDLGAGQSVICPVDVKLSSNEETYTVVLADCLKNVRSGGDLAVNQYDIHFENSRFVKSAVVVNGELNITLYSLAEVKQPGQVGSITVGLSSRNYNQIPMVFNLMAQGEPLDVTMSSWTYGETESGPEAVLPEGVTSLTITYAKADGTLLNEKPSDAGEYIVAVSCSKDGVIYSGTASFEIEPAPITADMVALDPDALTFRLDKNWSGIQQTQGVTVTWKGQPLADANYTLTGNTATDAGTYTLTVAGKGNFTGEVKKTWTVAPLPVGFDLDGDIRKDYDGTDAADVSISDWHVEGSSAPTTFQLPDNLYTVTGAAYDSAEAGEGKTVQFTVTLNENYAFSDGSRSKAFSSADFPGLTAAINKKQLAVKPDIPGTIYLPVGDNRTLSGCLSLDYFRGLYTDVKLPADAEITDVKLNEDSVSGVVTYLNVRSDGVVSYDIAHNLPANSKVNCTVTVSSENCDYIYTVSFTPVARAIPGGRPTLSRETLTYGEKLSAISLSGSMKGSDGSPVAGQFSWDYPEATPEVGYYTTNWTFKSYDSAYLDEIHDIIYIKVNKITLDSTPKFTLISTSGKTLADAGLAAASDWPEGTLTWDLPLETTVAANTAYGWTFTPADTAHYETVTGTILLYSVSGGGGSGGGGGGGRPGTPAAPSTPTTPTTPDVPSATEQPFADVAPEDWFYDAVTWAKGAGITGGVSQDRFGSGDPCTRGQIVTFLWRAAGSPAPKGQADMTDVPADAYYSTAVAWAVENGIASGTGANLFSPDAPCTRAQAVTFLWREAGSPAAQGDTNFHDVTDGDYFAQAVAWANEHDITDGVGGGLFGSMDSCTRSQIVTFLFMAR